MVAGGNPKRVRGLEDLRRPDLRVDLPNPVDEGIMSVYGRMVLARHGLLDFLSGGRECKACRPIPRVLFTEVHHREIPAALQDGAADVGLVWRTEVRNAVAAGLNVEGVDLPLQDSLRGEVQYLISPLTGTPHAALAMRYLRFLGTKPGRGAYAAHGFIPARPEESSLSRGSSSR